MYRQVPSAASDPLEDFRQHGLPCRAGSRSLASGELCYRLPFQSHCTTVKRARNRKHLSGRWASILAFSAIASMLSFGPPSPRPRQTSQSEVRVLMLPVAKCLRSVFPLLVISVHSPFVKPQRSRFWSSSRRACCATEHLHPRAWHFVNLSGEPGNRCQVVEEI